MNEVYNKKIREGLAKFVKNLVLILVHYNV